MLTRNTVQSNKHNANIEENEIIGNEYCGELVEIDNLVEVYYEAGNFALIFIVQRT